MFVLRAWRGGRVRAAGTPPDNLVALEGRTLRSRGITLVFDRMVWDDLSGQACRCEVDGDWLGASQRWSALGEGEGPVAGHARLRAALAHARLMPRSHRVRDGLVSALAACPALPEAALRLAAWHLQRGEVQAATTWAAFADAVPEPAPGVPHLKGAATWLVPARMARWLASADPERAALCARMALGRGPPAVEAELLLSIVGRVGPTPGEHAESLRDAVHPTPEEAAPWPT